MISHAMRTWAYPEIKIEGHRTAKDTRLLYIYIPEKINKLIQLHATAQK